MQVVPFRMPDDLLQRLDRYAAGLRAERPGLQVTRADAVRLLLIEALNRQEAKRGKA